MHAVVNVDKPKGLTSREAMVRAQRAMGAKKAGHAGTLDPIATGVLLVCLGEATKISSYLVDLEKEYLTTLRLGIRTDTFDADGKVVERREDVSVTESQVQEALARFRGEIMQVPPMYSAIKQGGQPLYKLARAGIEVQRKARPVLIKELELLEFTPPVVQIKVVCSKGTYVRTLADEIGQALGTGAHIEALRRQRVGHFSAGDAATPEELPAKGSAVFSLDSALRHFKQFTIAAKDFQHALNGGAMTLGISAGLFRTGQFLRLYGPGGEFFALGQVAGNKVRVKRIFHLKADSK